MKYVKIFAGLLIILTGIAYWQTQDYWQKPLLNQKNKIIWVKPNQSIRSLGNSLKEKGVIGSVEKFIFWARVFGHHRDLKVGEYLVKKDMTMAGLFRVLKSGKSMAHRLTIPEGYNLYEIARKVERRKLGKAETFIRLAKDKKLIKKLLGGEFDSLEGYLFPDTYFFTKSDGVRTIIKKMVSSFKVAYKEIPQFRDWSRHQVVTLASIIEKETGAPFERRQISSVFHNRLKKGMRLQTDPTVLYAKLRQTGKLSNNITYKDLRRQAPYNTYKIKGLPPGPIANPGIPAMKAAINPDGSAYLYFVSRNDGTHVFSKTYKEHKKAVKKFQLNPAARKNKSWRDLKKKNK